MNCAEYRDWVAADVDGVLGADEARVRAHLEECPTCRAERARQDGVRTTLRSRALAVEAPFGLRTRILGSLDEIAEEGVAGRSRLPRWAALVLAGLAVVLVLVPRGGGPLDPVVEEYYAAFRGEMPLGIRTSSLDELERFYATRAAEVVPGHVVDLGREGFRLVGGAVRRIDGRPYRLTVYSDGRNVILCDYRRAADYAGDVPSDGKPAFFVRAGITFCVRRMGDEVCILATRMPMHEVVPRLLGWT